MSTLAAARTGPTSPSVIPHSLKFGPSCCWSLPWLLAMERGPDTVGLVSQKVEIRGGPQESVQCFLGGSTLISSGGLMGRVPTFFHAVFSLRPLEKVLPRSTSRLGFGICPIYRRHLPPEGLYKVNVLSPVVVES